MEKDSVGAPIHLLNLKILSSQLHKWAPLWAPHRKLHRKTPVPELQACNVIKKETLAQVFSCECCEVSKNTFSYRTPPVAASGKLYYLRLHHAMYHENRLRRRTLLESCKIMKLSMGWFLYLQL